MEIVNLLQVLERRRRLLAAGFVAALLAGMAAAGLLPGTPGAQAGPPTGLAQARLLLDTPEPLAADLDAEAGTIGAQAALLADLLASHAQVRTIAEGARIPADRLTVRRPALTVPTVPSRLGERAAAVATPGHPYAVEVRASPTLPILSIDAFAPDPDAATVLARSTQHALEQLVAGRSGGLGVKVLEPVTATQVAGAAGRSKVLGVVAAVAVLVLWCAAIVAGAGLARVRAGRSTAAGVAG